MEFSQTFLEVMMKVQGDGELRADVETLVFGFVHLQIDYAYQHQWYWKQWIDQDKYVLIAYICIFVSIKLNIMLMKTCKRCMLLHSKILNNAIDSLVSENRDLYSLWKKLDEDINHYSKEQAFLTKWNVVI